MARYRIGTDKTIVWTVTSKDGSDFSLLGKDAHLYYTCERGRFEADIKINGTNQIVWEFLGKDQRVLGDYTLTLEVNYSNGKRSIRKDICNAFTLVGKNCEESDIADAHIDGDVITLATELEIFQIAPVVPTIGDNNNWWIDGTDTGKPATIDREELDKKQEVYVTEFSVLDLLDLGNAGEVNSSMQVNTTYLYSAIVAGKTIAVPFDASLKGMCACSYRVEDYIYLTVYYNEGAIDLHMGIATDVLFAKDVTLYNFQDWASKAELENGLKTKTETYIPEFTIEDIRNAVDGGYGLQVDLKDITAVREGKTIRVKEGEYGSHPCSAIIDENDILHLTIYASTHVYEAEIDDGADMRIRGVLPMSQLVTEEQVPFEKGEAENSAVLKGGNNQATSEGEVALGRYNKSNADTRFSIGIGTSEEDRKNALEVKANGDIYIEGVEGRIQDKFEKVFIMPEDFYDEDYGQVETPEGISLKIKEKYLLDILENRYTKYIYEDEPLLEGKFLYDDLPEHKRLGMFEHYAYNLSAYEDGLSYNINQTFLVDCDLNSATYCIASVRAATEFNPFVFGGDVNDGVIRYAFINMVTDDSSDIEEENKQLFKKKMGSFADWNANEGEAGHIENRTHYERSQSLELKDVRCSDYIELVGYDNKNFGEFIERATKVIVDYSYTEYYSDPDYGYEESYSGHKEIQITADKQVTIPINELQLDIETVKNADIGEGNVITLMQLFVAAPIKDGYFKITIEQLPKTLDEKYIPDTIARQSEIDNLSDRIDENEVLIEDLQNTKIDKEADDYYPQLAVGLADNLAGVDVVDSEINFRRSGGGAISDGVARIESIKGNSVVWNQFMDYGRAMLKNATMATELVNGKIIGYVNEAKSASDITFATITQSDIYYRSIIGHKYMWVFSSNNDSTMGSVGGKYDLKSGVVYEATSNGYCYIFPFGGSSTIIEANTFVEFSAVLYDLTKMFGAGNEPTTIEEFYARIPMGVDLNAYNEGEVIHMNVQNVESVGVNQWDEEWEIGGYSHSTGEYLDYGDKICNAHPIRILPNEQYYIEAPSNGYVYFYDENMMYIKNEYFTRGGVITSAPNAMFLNFNLTGTNTTYNHDICINISDPSINGKYFPYIKRVEDLSIFRNYFPQGMKSAGTAHDEIRYNKVTQKWEMVQRIGKVDMGTLSWTLHRSGKMYAPLKSTNTQYPMVSPEWGYIPFKCATKYQPIGSRGLSDEAEEGVIYAEQNQATIVIYDPTYTDAASFKADLQGVMLYYELAEPIVRELDEADQFKDLDYQVWNCGTEKAIAEGKSAPLAADITYGFNAIGKIKELESLVAALRAKVGI